MGFRVWHRAITLATLLAALTSVCAFNNKGVWFDRIFVIWLENTNYADARANPHFQRIERMGRLLTRMDGLAHPSQPNYIASVSGSFMGVLDSQVYNISNTTVVDLLEKNKISWKVYAESQPRACYLGEKYENGTCPRTYQNGSYAGAYVRRHNALASFTTITNSRKRCANLVPASELQKDIKRKQVPQFVTYIPNNCANSHSTDVNYSGAFLSWFFDTVLTQKAAVDHSTLVVVTYDENNSTVGNKVWTTLVAFNNDKGPTQKLAERVIPGSTDGDSYNTYSLLSTMLWNWGLGSMGRGDAKAQPFFTLSLEQLYGTGGSRRRRGARR